MGWRRGKQEVACAWGSVQAVWEHVALVFNVTGKCIILKKADVSFGMGLFSFLTFPLPIFML